MSKGHIVFLYWCLLMMDFAKICCCLWNLVFWENSLIPMVNVAFNHSVNDNAVVVIIGEKMHGKATG